MLWSMQRDDDPVSKESASSVLIENISIYTFSLHTTA